MALRRRFSKDREGATAIIMAISAMAVIGCAGLATDVGAVYLDSRRLQGTADLAALSAMQDPTQAQALADATVAANNWPADTHTAVTLGDYSADRAIAPDARFQRDGGSGAVQVEVASTTPLYFARLFFPSGQMRIVRHATAAQTRMASFQIGTRLLSLQGGIANQLLSGLTGSQVSLSVMDYDSLLNTDVDLLSYVDALHTRLHLQAASYNETLSHPMDTPDALDALADVLGPTDSRAANAMRQIAGAAGHIGSIDHLNNLIDLGAYGAQDHATLSGETAIKVNAMDLATAILEIAGGARQVRLQLGASVPGVATTTVWLAIGERPNNSPWITVTDSGDPIIRTAQTRLYIEADVRPALAALVNVKVPLLVELASGQARLADVQCGASSSGNNVTLSVAPGIGSLSLGEIDTAQLDNFQTALQPSAAHLVNAGLITVDGSARIDVGGDQWTSVRFNGSDINAGTMKTVATRDAAQATVSSLIGRTQLSVHVGGLGLGLGAPVVTSAVQSTLAGVTAPLDGLIDQLTDLLGVRLGEADVRVNGVRCGGAALVA